MAIPVPEKRIEAFEKFGFGMFIHWGLYSQLGKGEWIQNREHIPCEVYDRLADTFTACDFDAEKIAKLAKKAGMKYITLTTRHHDGFSLYDTCGLTDFDAPHSAAKRDLIREFVDACRSEGIKPFFYHTTLDWHQKIFNTDFKAYLKYLRDSVEILCTNYGEIGGLWFDGNWSKPGADWEEDALYGMIRKHQPEAMIINNTGLQGRGRIGNPELDSVTFEQGRPVPMDREGMPKYLAAEMCQTINAHWGIGTRDFDYQSLGSLIENLCACRKVGANYLLNIGPTAQGGIVKLQEALLESVGEWIAFCGNSIYEGKPCGITSGKDFALKQGNKLFFFIHDLAINGSENVTVGRGGAGPRAFAGVKDRVRNLKWVDNGEKLYYAQNLTDGMFSIDCTGYPYGYNLVVRVAEAELE